MRYRYYTVMNNGILTTLGDANDALRRSEPYVKQAKIFAFFKFSKEEYVAIIEEGFADEKETGR